MSAVGAAFVTPHAVARFRERIAPLPYETARAIILDGLAHNAAVRVEQRPDGYRAEVGCDGRYRFVAVVVAPPERGLLPVVVTVKPATRGRRLATLDWERPCWQGGVEKGGDGVV